MNLRRAVTQAESRALPPQTSMPRAERLRLKRERAARAQRAEARARRAEARQILQTLRTQADYLVIDPGGLANCPETRDLIAAARANGLGRFEFGGLRFTAQPGSWAIGIYGPGRRHLVSFLDL